jgi:hypothetical protein
MQTLHNIVHLPQDLLLAGTRYSICHANDTQVAAYEVHERRAKHRTLPLRGSWSRSVRIITRVGVSKANPLIPSDKRPEPARTVDRGTITGHEMAALACHNLGAPRALTSQLRSHWHGRTLGNLDPRRASISAAAYPSYQRWGRTSRLRGHRGI